MGIPFIFEFLFVFDKKLYNLMSKYKLPYIFEL